MYVRLTRTEDMNTKLTDIKTSLRASHLQHCTSLASSNPNNPNKSVNDHEMVT